MSEFASTTAPAIEASHDIAVLHDDVVVKPKPRKPRAKPQPVIQRVERRKTVVRLPVAWTAELRAKPLPETGGGRPPAKPGVRLLRRSPAGWHSPPSAPLLARKPGCRLPQQWALPIRQSRLPQPATARRQRAARLPEKSAAVIRASVVRAQALERSLPLPEPAKECDVTIKRIVEAILFAANKPMTIRQIQEAFPELEQPDTLAIQTALEAIAQDYLTRPIGLKQLASGYRFQIREGLAPWVTRLFEEKPARYSRALLETLSIIAYRQPVTRGEIEDIRGVSVSSSIIHTLLEREWIRVIAHKEVPGRPALYGTTKQFLDYFNLTSLSELPTLDEIASLDFSNEPIQQENRERPQTQSAETEAVSAASADGQAATATLPQPEAGSGDDSANDENRTLH